MERGQMPEGTEGRMKERHARDAVSRLVCSREESEECHVVAMCGLFAVFLGVLGPGPARAMPLPLSWVGLWTKLEFAFIGLNSG